MMLVSLSSKWKRSLLICWAATAQLGLLLAAPGIAGQAPLKSNVILITVDTLRADHLGCYGDASALTPTIDALAGDGIRFDRVTAHVPLTLPSHCSIMTGTYPLFHGVRDNIGYVLSDEHVTAAEILKAQGYQTCGFVGAFVLDRKTGLAQGFDLYSDEFAIDLKQPRLINLGYVERSAGQVVEHAMQWIRAREGRPFFAWIHLFDPHDPYRPPEPFASRFRSDPYRGEIAYADQQLGRLMLLLREAGIYDSSIIVLTSDHGESLGQHGEPTHGLFVYEAAVRVPLIIKLAGSQHAGKTVHYPVQSVDILPTLTQLLGLDKPPAVQGVGLLGAILGKQPSRRPIYTESLYPRTQFGWSSLRGFHDGNFKYIRAPRPELYDLSADPDELKNLADQEMALTNRLDGLLQQFITRFSAKHSPSQTRPVDPESLEKLRSLGYAGFSAGSFVEGIDDKDLADPKDKTEVYKLVLQEMRLANESNGEQRIQRLEAILEKDPNLTMVLSSLGEAYQRAGKYDEAIDALQKSLAIRPWDESLIFLMGYCYLQRGDIDAAVTGFRQVLDIHPAHHGARYNLGVALTRQDKLDAAAEQFHSFLEQRPDDPQGHEGLGYVLLKKGLVDDAFEEFQSALRIDPEMANAHLWLGFCQLEKAKNHQKVDPGDEAIPGLVADARRWFSEAVRLDQTLRSKIPPSMLE